MVKLTQKEKIKQFKEKEKYGSKAMIGFSTFSSKPTKASSIKEHIKSTASRGSYQANKIASAFGSASKVMGVSAPRKTGKIDLNSWTR